MFHKVPHTYVKEGKKKQSNKNKKKTHYAYRKNVVVKRKEREKAKDNGHQRGARRRYDDIVVN